MAIATTGSPRTAHRRRDMKLGPRGHVKAAELVSGMGAIVLGAGAALMLPELLRADALPLLAGLVLSWAAGLAVTAVVSRFALKAQNGFRSRRAS